MRAFPTIFTALVAAALVVPSFAAPIEKRAKVCPAKDDQGSPLTHQEVTSNGLLGCSYAAAGGCEYFLGNGNFSSGASTCPDAGLDPGAPGASTGGGASDPVPPAASGTTGTAPTATPTGSATTTLPPLTLPPPTALPVPETTPVLTRTLTTSGTGSAVTPRPTNAALGRYVPHGTALLSGLVIVLSTLVL
jgi:hypothetical protein